MVAMGMRATPSRRSNAARTLACAVITALFPFLIQGCAGGTKKPSFRYQGVKAIPVGAATRGEAIDGYEAYVVQFRLEKAVEAMTVGISAEYVADITGKKKYKKAYFIVEKIVDLPGAGGTQARRISVEMGRNFDADWNREKDITIRSLKTVPFRTLDAESLYRIRFTAFSRDPFDYTITVDADAPVTFIDDGR
jgi:hypothetical protein